MTTAAAPTPAPTVVRPPRLVRLRRLLGPAGGPWVLVVVAVGVLLRLAPMVAQLPFTHNPDESRSINAIGLMVDAPTTDTTVYSYPALMFNLEAATLAVWDAVVGAAAEPLAFSSPGATRTVDQAAVVLMRSLGLAASTATMLLAAVLARRVSGRDAAALLAAALVAVNPLDVRLGATVTPDPFAGALATAAVLAAVALAERLTTRRVLVAGALVGLATAAKFNAVLVAAAPAAAVGLHRLGGRRTAALLGTAGGAAVVAFVVASPQTVLDLDTYWFWFRREQEHYRSGHPGYEGGAGWYYLATIGRMVGPVLVAVPALIVADRMVRRRATPVLVAVVVYVGWLATYVTRFDRNMLVVSGALAALAATGLVVAAERWARSWRPAPLLLGAAALAVPGALSARTIVRVEQDPWTAARAFILDAVPAGEQLLVESYGPWLPDEPLVVRGVLRAIDPPLEWYHDEGVSYVVTVDEVRNRYRDADRYPLEHAAYERLLGGTCVMRAFASDEVTIELRRVLPLDSSPTDASAHGSCPP